MTYFSERENGERPRESAEISEEAWGGIQALVRARIADGSLGAGYGENCPDGAGLVGTDESAFWLAMRGENPALHQNVLYDLSEEQPRTLDILDMIEFCWRCIGKPIRGGYHDFFRHYHLSFDVEAGQHEFRDSINRIFRRNGLAYELTEQGRIERLAAPVLREELASVQFQTGDSELDGMLERARRKFLDSEEEMRRESLEALWDAWERLKTVVNGPNKKVQVASLLDNTADSSTSDFRKVLEQEAKELTWIGNNLQIRHSETSQERLVKGEHVDYLFHRLLAFIQMVLRTSGRV